MILLPFETYTIKTNLPTQEIKNRLEQTIEPELSSIFFRSNSGRPYRGKISATKFSMCRNLFYTNSFNPIILGEISTQDGVSLIHLKIRLHLVILAFLIPFLIITGFIGFGELKSQIERGYIAFEENISLIMFVSFYVISILAFKFETRRTKKYLTQLLLS